MAPVRSAIRRAEVVLVAALLVALASAGCATTTVDDPATAVAPSTEATSAPASAAGPVDDPDRVLAADDTTPLEPGVVVADDVEPTVVAPGTPLDELPRIGVEMSRLSSQIGGDGDEDDTLQVIVDTWTGIEDQVRAERPDLVERIASTIEMARVAVDRNRPADADKAFSLLTRLVDAYTGDD